MEDLLLTVSLWEPVFAEGGPRGLWVGGSVGPSMTEKDLRQDDKGSTPGVSRDQCETDPVE